MSDLPLQFPVMMLTQSTDCCHDDDVSHDADRILHHVDCFPDEDSFTRVNAKTLEYGYGEDARVVDASGKCWRIVGMVDLSAMAASWRDVLTVLFGLPRRVRYQLSEEAPIPFEVVRHHVCAAIQGYSVHGIDEEAIPGKPDSLFRHQALIDAKTEQCRMTTDMDELIAALKIKPNWRRPQAAGSPAT